MPLSTTFDATREAVLTALERARPILEADDAPTNLSFVVYFDQVGRVRKVITRTETDRDLSSDRRVR